LNFEVNILVPIIPPRIPLEQEMNCQPPRPPPRSLSMSKLYVIRKFLKLILYFQKMLIITVRQQR